jgi:hypothetical protein
MRRPASRNSSLRSEWVASVEPLPGSDRPRASVRQFIELAVNMPEQEPQVGQAERSIVWTSSSHDLVVGGGDHGVDQVERMNLAVGEQHLAGFHRAAGDEDRRDVEAQRGHQHAGGDLVAVGDADHGIGAVGVDHVFDAVGDEFARRQRIEHAVMAHGDAVIDGDGVEFLGDAAGASISRATSWPRSLRWTWPGTNWVNEFTTAIIGLPNARPSAGHVPSCPWRAIAGRAKLRPRRISPCCGRGCGGIVVAWNDTDCWHAARPLQSQTVCR